MAKAPKTRASGTMTESGFVSFIKSALRSKSRFWKPLSDTLKEAKVSRGLYLCNVCKQEVPVSHVVNGKRRKNIVVDHINPVVDPTTGFVDWNQFIENLFCERDNLQAICSACHTDIKTKGESEERKSMATLRKNYESEYQSWSNMNDRCLNPKATGYAYYGARGITVCDRWKRDGTAKPFQNFLEDMGQRPEGKTLDRVDYTKGYNADNCRWATTKEQARNTSANNWLEYNGEFKILQDWGETLGIKPNSILTRLRRGWSVAQALGFEEKPKARYSGRLTQEDFAHIAEGLREKKSIREIAKDLEMDESQVSRIASKFSLGKPAYGKVYEMAGEQLTLPEWATRFGINYETLVYRLKQGNSLEDALTKPVRALKSKAERTIRSNNKKEQDEL